MKYYFLFIILLTPLILYFSPSDFKYVSNLQENWQFDKTRNAGIETDKRFPNKPKEILNGYRKDSGIYFFNTGFIPIPENSLIEYPTLGKGFYSYKKIGSTISYKSNEGEILWEKPFQSYPRINPFGNLLFLVSGDGNQVLISNQNGNLTGAERIDGRFLTDIAYPNLASGAFVLFSGGELFSLNGEGQILFKKAELKNSKEIQFVKSGAVSPRSKFYLIHSFINDRDRITALNEKAEIIYMYELEKIYPHKIYMSIDDEKNSLINLPDSTVLLDAKGKLVWKKIKKEEGRIYQISFGSDDFFAYTSNADLVFINKKGFEFKRKKISNLSRLLPSRKNDLIFLETENSISSLQIIE
jgi:hypothetical protein